jgi:hypothetical protein
MNGSELESIQVKSSGGAGIVEVVEGVERDQIQVD